MKRRAIWYPLVAIFVLIGFLGGLAVNALIVSAADPAAVKVMWSKVCEGDRVIVTRSMLVKCVKDVPPPLPTPSPAPTAGMPEPEP